jgi:hypothetical protein
LLSLVCLLASGQALSFELQYRLEKYGLVGSLVVVDAVWHPSRDLEGTLLNPIDPAGQRRLHAQIQETDLTVVVNYMRNGPVGLGVFDPEGRLPWTSDDRGLTKQSYLAGDSTILVVEGQYAEHCASRGRCPILPADGAVAGTVSSRVVPEETQFVYSLFAQPLRTGRYTIQSGNTEDVEWFLDELGDLGFQLSEVPTADSLLAYSASWPEQLALVAGGGAALVCFGIMVAARASRGRRNIAIRRLNGASTPDLLRHAARRDSLGTAVGTVSAVGIWFMLSAGREDVSGAVVPSALVVGIGAGGALVGMGVASLVAHLLTLRQGRDLTLC